MNDAIIEMLEPDFLLGWQILHLAGRDHAAEVRAAYQVVPDFPARVVDFTPDMADVWAVADLCVSRSGPRAVAPS